jgi:hypothetical protein
VLRRCGEMARSLLAHGGRSEVDQDCGEQLPKKYVVAVPLEVGGTGWGEGATGPAT